jgi:RimJ/RimL family protein N-acetyltransferase
MIPRLQTEAVLLEPATEANVDLLVRWTLDPVAQGSYKRVPEMSGVGSAAQALAVQHLLGRPSTRSVFAYTAVENHAERRALQKAGLRELGPLSHQRYPVLVPDGEWVVYSTRSRTAAG